MFDYEKVMKEWHEEQNAKNGTEKPTNAPRTAKAEYIAEAIKGEKNAEYWRKYYEKSISEVYRIGGYLVKFDKPTIETRFCFGYGMYGISTQEEINEACEREEHAATNESYFIVENLKQFDELEKATQKAVEDMALNWAKGSHGCEIAFASYRKGGDLPNVEALSYSGVERAKDYATFYKPLNAEEIELYKEALRLERAKFEKRLKAYLKRYGLSNLKTWTYLVD